MTTYVTRTQRLAAQIMIELAEARGTTVDPAIERIANAEIAPADEPALAREDSAGQAR